MIREQSLALLVAAFLSTAGVATRAGVQEEQGTVQEAVRSAGPELIQMTVLGLSCPFCAYGLEKKLRKIEGVSRLEIDLKTGRVHLEVQDGSEAADARLEELVKEAGFEIEGKIARSPLAEQKAEERSGGR